MLYLSLEDTEWPWVALVCMQTVALMPVEITPRQKIYVEIAPPSLTQWAGLNLAHVRMTCVIVERVCPTCFFNSFKTGVLQGSNRLIRLKMMSGLSSHSFEPSLTSIIMLSSISSCPPVHVQSDYILYITIAR